MKKSTRFLSLLLSLVLCLGMLPGAALAAEEPTAVSFPQTVLVDDKEVTFYAYALVDENGGITNYVKLRDVAAALNGTKAQFEVGWDGAINLETGKSYTAVGGELTQTFAGDKPYAVGDAPVNVNGSPADLAAITLWDDNGGNYNYFKLRDLGKALGFNVGWSPETGIFIETDKPYADETQTDVGSEPVETQPAAPAMAYTSDKLLWAGNVPLAGVVMIDGEYYLSVEVLNQNGYSYQMPFGFSGTSASSEYYYMFRNRYTQSSETVTLMKPIVTIKAGQEIGETAAAAKPLSINGEIIENAIRTIDGRYPMIRLSALPESFGYRDEGDRLVLCGDATTDTTVVWEEDLAGQALASLVKDSPRATAQAIHDYLVNTLTHTDGMDKSYWQKNDPNRHERGEELYQKYHFSNNYHLAWGYGVCQHYAELFQTMCIQAGIPCQLVTGEPDHAWNRVYIDGAWRYVDVTWDDPTGSSPTLLQEYFLVDAEKMAVKHYWDDEDYPMPREYDPAWEKLDPNNITSADMFRKCLVAQLMQQKTSFSLKVTVSGAYGGTGCMYAYQSGWDRTYYTSWSSMRCQYNSQTNSYDFTVSYW